MKTITMIDPTTSNTYDIPVYAMTEYMLQGLQPLEDQSKVEKETFLEETNQEDVTFYEPDIDASEAVDRDIANADFSSAVEHTKENIVSALNDVCVLNAAIAHLGDMQTCDELAAGTANHLNGEGFSAAFARTGRRLWQWTTGKDAKTMEERWEKKCLSHTRADAAFQRQTRNYDFSTAVELARYVAAFHWRQIGFILEPDFAGYDLPKADKKKSYNNPTPSDWVDITGARVIQVKGGGTQLLWDSRRIWLPTSQMKKINGSLKIPSWLAQKNDMI